MKSTLVKLSCLVFILESCASPKAKPEHTICSIHSDAEVQAYAPMVQPKYFFKPVGSAHEIAFVGFDPKDSADHNYLFNLDTGQTTIIPGVLDPIGLFNTNLVAIPLYQPDGQMRMSFYDLDDLHKNGTHAPPLLAPDQTLQGRYQSMGILSQSGSRTRFRIITDGHFGGDFRDFEVDFSRHPAKLKPVSKTRMLCSNLRKKGEYLNYKLPMISKNAKLFSAFDVTSQQMKVFELTEKGACQEISGPAFGKGDIGKLDFSPDGESMAFHYSDRSLDYTPIEFGAPLPSWQLKSAVYHRSDQSYQVLPISGFDASTYFPAFLPNGNLMTLEIHDDQARFLEFRLDHLKRISREKIEKLYQIKSEDFFPYQWLSEQWMSQCSSVVTKSMRYNRLLMIFGWTKAQCLEVIASAKRLPSKNEMQIIKSVCDLL